MLDQVHRVVSARLFADETIATNLACPIYESISLHTPPSLNHLIRTQSKELGIPLADTFYAILAVLTLQAAERTSGPFLLIDNCRDQTNSNVFGMVLREFGCVFQYEPALTFRSNLQRAAGTVSGLPQAYRRMFPEFAYGEFPELYVNNYDGILLNFLAPEMDRGTVTRAMGLASGDPTQWLTNLWSRSWVNQYDRLMEHAATRGSYNFSSNLVCEFKGAELTICGRATSVSWFAEKVWPLLLQQAELQSPTFRGRSPRARAAQHGAEPSEFSLL